MSLLCAIMPKKHVRFFTGNVTHHLHIGFDDPAEATGTEEEVIASSGECGTKSKNSFMSFINQT